MVKHPNPSTLSTKGNTMKEINISTIVSIASGGVDKELASYGIDPLAHMSEFQKAMAEAMAKKRSATVADAAELAMELFATQQNDITNTVISIREHRRNIAILERKIERLQLTRAYAEETINFLPLLGELGWAHDHYSKINQSLLSVPESWKPKTAIAKVDVPKGAERVKNKKLVVKSGADLAS
jgi:hypothetical protein